MKIRKSDWEILGLEEFNYQQIVKKIEAIGRVCYKSEANITPESGEEFIRKIIKHRGVSHEMVKHRLASFSQESTRYVRSCEKKDIKIETEQDCINSYLDGLSMRRISELSLNKYTEWEVYKILDSNNVERRKLGNTGLINSNYFNSINTWDKAYLIGFILGDGNIRKESNQISISQKDSEEWFLLNMIRNFIQPNAKSLSISDNNIKTNLINKGIIPNKTYDMNKSHVELLWSSIPHDMIYDFLRGFLDSDGSIRWFYQKDTSQTHSCNICFNGNIFILQKIQELLEKEFNYIVKIHDSDSAVMKRLFITDSKVGKEFCEKLYKNFVFPYGHSKTANWYEPFNIDIPIETRDNDKFAVIKPFSLKGKNLWVWGNAMFNSELAYNKLVDLGESPQIARSVLPNSLMIEIVVTANLRE
ncbi:MAG TPA: FAD-dependent thymidylate synthase [Patescibacteria group bacterium]|nr:FAD-dependent thymidylate synthase [Patescibacteria group bacterium]